RQIESDPPGHWCVTTHVFRRTRAPYRTRLGTPPGTASPVLARNHHARPPFYLCEPWAPSAPALARGCRSPSRTLAAVEFRRCPWLETSPSRCCRDRASPAAPRFKERE